MKPLAERMRPHNINDLVGLEALDPQLVDMMRTGLKRSLILVGPPSSGKTTIARLIASATPGVAVEQLSAVHAGKAQLDKLRKDHKDERLLLILDEIHRWNKAQQDALLEAVETGEIMLIGATTETPYVTLNAALLSRCTTVRIAVHSTDELIEILMRAAGHENEELDAEAAVVLAAAADGDARRALSLLEAVLPGPVTVESLPEQIQLEGRGIDAGLRADYVSAWIKSMRATDPDAAVWYLAQLLHSQEDAVFLARRLMIFASEDVGLAQSSLLSTCVAAAQSVQLVGMPEARIILAHACLACAVAPKSNSAYAAIGRALQDVKSHPTERPPINMRDAHHPGARMEGAGQGYEYPHDHGGYVKSQLLPDQAARRITPGSLWRPSKAGAEGKIKDLLERLRSKEN